MDGTYTEPFTLRLVNRALENSQELHIPLYEDVDIYIGNPKEDE